MILCARRGPHRVHTRVCQNPNPRTRDIVHQIVRQILEDLRCATVGLANLPVIALARRLAHAELRGIGRKLLDIHGVHKQLHLPNILLAPILDKTVTANKIQQRLIPLHLTTSLVVRLTPADVLTVLCPTRNLQLADFVPEHLGCFCDSLLIGGVSLRILLRTTRLLSSFPPRALLLPPRATLIVREQADTLAVNHFLRKNLGGRLRHACLLYEYVMASPQIKSWYHLQLFVVNVSIQRRARPLAPAQHPVHELGAQRDEGGAESVQGILRRSATFCDEMWKYIRRWDGMDSAAQTIFRFQKHNRERSVALQPLRR